MPEDVSLFYIRVPSALAEAEIGARTGLRDRDPTERARRHGARTRAPPAERILARGAGGALSDESSVPWSDFLAALESLERAN